MLSGVPSFADIASGRRVKPHSESQSPMIPRIKVESGSMVTMCRSSGIQTRCRKVRKGNGQFGRSLRINMSETTAMAKNAPSEIHASESEESNKKGRSSARVVCY